MGVHVSLWLEPTMADSIDDIFQQARQGSVAAIIQILNEKLADNGVRTRAVLEDGVLQLLCEAATPEQLEQSKLVSRIRQILEAISPQNIRKVHLNGRIVREQQLLWLEEIRRDPEGQLLWSERITLARPNPIKRLLDDRKLARRRSIPLPQAGSRSDTANRSFIWGLVGGAGLIAGLLVIGWSLQDRLNLGQTSVPPTATNTSTTSPADPQPEGTTEPPAEPSPSPTPASGATADPFGEAVSLATQAASDGTRAQTPTEWLDLATRWQRASDLMAQVPPEDSRYAIAQQRVKDYQNNSNLALQQAERSRVQ
jgi:hypothetical protein